MWGWKGEWREGMVLCKHRSLDLSDLVSVQFGIVNGFVGGRLINKFHESVRFSLGGVQGGIRTLSLENYGY